MTIASPELRTSKRNAPTWAITQFFPTQGNWTEEDYLELESKIDGNPLIELSDGFLEILPMPKFSHQLIVRFILKAFEAFIEPRGLGVVIFAPLRVRLWPGRFSEPDIVFMLSKHRERAGEDFWEGADLVVEVVSPDPDSRKRDLKTKRADYAKAGIPEYWIIDMELKQITVLRLNSKRYVVHGKFGVGAQATSALLRGFSVDVKAALTH
jgi:Uma2 family endonuclease